MQQFFLICAVLGGTIFACQFVLSLFGLGDHHDLGGLDHDVGGGFDHDVAAGDHASGGEHAAGEIGHDSAMSWFVGVLTVRTVVAGLTFFGLAGLAANASGAHPAGSLAVAGAAGITALYVVAWIMKSLYRLRADGTVRIHNALGQTGAVYLTIPARKTGRGKVTVTLQNRTMEYEAETDQSEIPTGATVRVVAVVDSETLAVETVPEPARPHHV